MCIFLDGIPYEIWSWKLQKWLSCGQLAELTSGSLIPLAWPIGRFRSNRPRKLQWISERKTQFCHSMSQIGQNIFTQYPMVGYNILINILIIFRSKQEQTKVIIWGLFNYFLFQYIFLANSHLTSLSWTVNSLKYIIGY